MHKTDAAGDIEGRDMIRLTVLNNVLRQPVPLGELVMKLEGLVFGELGGSPRHISRCLHEMDREGHIILANSGKGWNVSLGPKGRDTFERLMGGTPAEKHSPLLMALGHRIRAAFAALPHSFSV